MTENQKSPYEKNPAEISNKLRMELDEILIQNLNSKKECLLRWPQFLNRASFTKQNIGYMASIFGVFVFVASSSLSTGSVIAERDMDYQAKSQAETKSNEIFLLKPIDEILSAEEYRNNMQLRRDRESYIQELSQQYLNTVRQENSTTAKIYYGLGFAAGGVIVTVIGASLLRKKVNTDEEKYQFS
ncbi:MAG: hypothetical protein Q7R97_02390 [Candidatus Daviesbacteria bacterium]|nr:hypothetical protein [Candidatus Daviesbacteria bacterium]